MLCHRCGKKLIVIVKKRIYKCPKCNKKYHIEKASDLIKRNPALSARC